MVFNQAKAKFEVARRNDIRHEAGLPLIDQDAELQRLERVSRVDDFEAYFQRERVRYQHLWQDKTHGFFTRMGIYSQVRTKLRSEFLQ